jgi:hypothetical protein
LACPIVFSRGIFGFGWAGVDCAKLSCGAQSALARTMAKYAVREVNIVTFLSKFSNVLLACSSAKTRRLPTSGSFFAAHQLIKLLSRAHKTLR